MEEQARECPHCWDWTLWVIVSPEEKIFTERLELIYYLSYYLLNSGRNMDPKGHFDEMSERNEE